YRSGGRGSLQALCRQQSRLQQLPPPRRNEEVRHPAVRAVGRVSPLQRPLRGGDDHRGPVNACMTRSMNGRPLPAAAPEMQALLAYSKFLSTGVAPGQLLPGLGTGNMPELDRAADPARGAASYANACVACHGPNGAGIRRSLPTTDLGYMVPPLWGND